MLKSFFFKLIPSFSSLSFFATDVCTLSSSTGIPVAALILFVFLRLAFRLSLLYVLRQCARLL